MGEDRRGQERAEIVGQLWGSLGVVHPVKDIGRGGALVETGSWAPTLSVRSTRLAVDGIEGAAEVRMCRVQPETGPDGQERYRIGLEFLEVAPGLLEEIDDLVAAHASSADASTPASDERRRVPRVPVRAEIRCELTTWSTVRLVDVSLGGALLVSSRPVSGGERAELRLAFDGDPFSSGIEVRRVEAEGREGETGSFRLGVRFRDGDDDSRRALGQFLRRAIV